MGNRHNKWVRKKLDELKEEFGGRCSNPECESCTNLEFAHKKPTELSGEGRGRKERYYDIIRNKKKYVLLCTGCHKAFDKGKITL